MNKLFAILIGLVIIVVAGVLIFQFSKKGKEPSPKQESFSEENLNMSRGSIKKIAMIIAFRDFRDEEYFIPRNKFLGAGFSIDTASTSSGLAIGAGGGEAKVDISVEELAVSDYDAILFIGGAGAVKYIDDERFHQLARAAVEADKVLGAICVAPAILAKAGVLEGKEATVWSSALDKSAVKILKESGAEYQKESVVADGKIITADGPAAASDWAEEVIKALAK